MRYSILSIGFALILCFAVAATQQPSSRSPNGPAQVVPHQKPSAGTGVYCPSKEERGSFCLEGGLRASNNRGCTPLMRAAERGDIEQVRALIKRGANVNAAWPHWGITALMIAAGEGHLEVVQALLDAGADPNAVSYGHGGVPSWAWMFGMNRCNKDWLAVTDAMLGAGVEVNPKTIYPSPLAYAIEKDDTVIIEALLKRGANVNLRDQETGETPLMFAARYSTAQVVRALLEAGADPIAKSKQGKTALAMAEDGKDNLWRDEIVALLKQSAAKQ